ncbi:MAG: hypothetical protein KGY50_02715 [Candidatus Thermoplasmatota archaeon]|nr:hypothetical protein [Candidatus Thermoplasmatota archaeon]
MADEGSMLKKITYKLFFISIIIILFINIILIHQLALSQHLCSPVSHSIIPKLKWDPKFFDFGIVLKDQTYTTTFEIWNNGTGEMFWQVDPCKNWVTIHPRTGSSTGEHDRVNLTINTHGLSIGSYEGNAVIHSAGDFIFYTYFTVSDKKLDFFPKTYDFDGIEVGSLASTNLTISNNGTGMLNWSLSTSHDWLTVFPKQGLISADPQVVEVFIDTNLIHEKLTNTIVRPKVFINSTGGNDIFSLSFYLNQPPSNPVIQGPKKFKINSIQEFTVSSTDDENNSLSYYVDWGDGKNTGWIGPFLQKQQVSINHSWQSKGTFSVKAKVKDNYGCESNWSFYPITIATYQSVYTILEQHFRFCMNYKKNVLDLFLFKN